MTHLRVPRRALWLAAGAAVLATAVPSLGAPPAKPGTDITSVTDPVTAANAAAVRVVGTTATKTGKVQVVAQDSAGATVTAETPRVRSTATFDLPLDATGLRDGAITVTAKVGKSTDTMTVSKDASAPAAPTIVVDRKANARTTTIAVSGSTGEAGSWSASVTGDGPTVTDGGPTSDGTYGFSFPAGSFGDGAIVIAVRGTDTAGNTGEATTATVTKDTAQPSLAEVSVVPAVVGTATSGAVEVRGTSDGGAGTTVQVVLSGVSADTGEPRTEARTVDLVNGAFSALFDTTGYRDGAQALSFAVQATSGAGNPGPQQTVTAAKDTAAPTVAGLAASYVGSGESTTTVRGTTEPGAAVQLTLSRSGVEVKVAPVRAGLDGAFLTLVDVDALANGAVQVAAGATDAAGNTATGTTSFEKDARLRGDTIAVDGLDKRLWVRHPGGVFGQLGGELLDAPNVVTAGARTLYVGLGSDRNVYVRDDARAWARLAPVGTACHGPSAAVNGTTLTVACRGGDGQMWVGKGQVPSSGLPTVGAFAPLGGGLLHGAAVRPDGSGFRYTVVGTDRNVYTRTDAVGGFTRVSGAPACSGPIGQAPNGVSSCASATGSAQLFGTGSASRDLGGRIIGRPGVAVDDDGAVRVHVLGTDKQVWSAYVSPLGRLAPFGSAGGAGTYGLSAVSRTPAA